MLLINVGVDPLKHHRDLNILMTTERTDSLSYAGVRDNLVLTLDQVTLNSWNEVMVSRYDGPHALLDCLRDYLNQLPPDHLPRACGCAASVTTVRNSLPSAWRKSSTPRRTCCWVSPTTGTCCKSSSTTT